MKLYTEDSFHQKLFNHFIDEHNLILLESEMDEIIRIVKSNYIELPSDKEIEKQSYKWVFASRVWEQGAKWMKEQILNQNK